MQAGILYRTYTARAVDDEQRTIELSFSSEEPVDRYFGKEILDHSPGSVRLGRLNTGAPLLLEHDTEKQIGVIERAELGSDRKGRALARFSRSQRAEEIFQDVKDNIRTLISVGYRIYKATLTEQSDNGDTYRVTDWEPLEVSIVSVPADVTVGIGRNDDSAELNNVEITKKEIPIMEDTKITQDQPQGLTAEDRRRLESDIRTSEMERIREIQETGANFNMATEADKAIRDGMSAVDFKLRALKKLETAKSIDAQTSDVGLEGKELEEYSVQRGLQALLKGDWSHAPHERDVTREMEKKFGVEARGLLVPYEVMKRTLTTASGGTGLIATDHLAANFIEMLRNKATVMQLGSLNLTGLKGDVAIPKQTGAATAYWLATEGTSTPTASDSAFSTVSLSPKNVAAKTIFSRNMLLQSNPSIEMLVMEDLARVLGLAIDLAAINGSGASGQPTGIINTSGVGAVAGASFDWSKAVELETDVRAANADLGSMYYLTNATINGGLKTTEKATNTAQFLVNNGEMNGYPVAVSNQVPSGYMLFGAFSSLIIGMWGGLDITVDPYSSGDAGNTIIRAFQTVDIAVRQAAAFSVASSVSF